MKNSEEILNREKEFHDKHASDINVHEISVDAYFESSTCPENRFILQQIGDLKEKKILDLGCGAGENSVYFAKKGAKCTATDFSGGMVKVTLALAKKYNVEIHAHEMNAMEISYPDNTFDFVYASNLLHHVNPHKTLKEMHRVLKPGGKACFWDPLSHNPIINVYRMMATEVRTKDEKPLNISIIKYLRALFSEVNYDTFWISALWIFLHFYLVEHVHPNKERYWKKIIYEEERLRPLYLKLEKIDNLIKRFPFVKALAWNIAVVATK